MRLFTNQSFVFVCTAILMETTRQANVETNFTLEIVETIRKSHAQSLAKKKNEKYSGPIQNTSVQHAFLLMTKLIFQCS